jgi:hypothetical protein
MTFTSESAKQLAIKANEMKKKYAEDRMAYISSGGLRKALAVIDLMFEGEKVTKEQKEAVELLQKYLPYKKPKLAHEQRTVKHQFEGKSKEELEERAAELISGIVTDSGGTGKEE